MLDYFGLIYPQMSKIQKKHIAWTKAGNLGGPWRTLEDLGGPTMYLYHVPWSTYHGPWRTLAQPLGPNSKGMGLRSCIYGVHSCCETQYRAHLRSEQQYGAHLCSEPQYGDAISYRTPPETTMSIPSACW